MNNLKNIIFYFLFFLVFSCSSEETNKSINEHDDLSTLDDYQESFKFESISIAPEDKILASLAPEGMVFIKGGCFILGNNYAQVDESPEHEVCVDDFYLDKYEVVQVRWENEIKSGNYQLKNMHSGKQSCITAVSCVEEIKTLITQVA